MTRLTTNGADAALAHLAARLFRSVADMVLAWLFGQPGQAYYFSELKRHTGVGQGALQRELATLTEAGLLERTTRGRHVFFAASPDNPIYEELRSILAKIPGAVAPR